MDIKTKVREAQRLTIDHLAQYETEIAELYAAYGNTFSETADFWRMLSNEERAHARLLKSMHKLLNKGYIFYNLGRFDRQTINALITKVKTELAEVKEKPISVLRAITVALTIETSIMDAHFYEIVTSDAPEFKIIADHLSKATKQHIEQIQEQLMKQQSN